MEISIYTDGGAIPNNSRGQAGAGYVFIKGNTVTGYAKSLGTGTNNFAEISAINEAVVHVAKKLEASNVDDWTNTISLVVHTDSEYAMNMVSGDWQLKSTSANRELIQETKKNIRRFNNWTIKHVRGHAGNKYNEMADELAGLGIAGKTGKFKEECIVH